MRTAPDHKATGLIELSPIWRAADTLFEGVAADLGRLKVVGDLVVIVGAPENRLPGALEMGEGIRIRVVKNGVNPLVHGRQGHFRRGGIALAVPGLHHEFHLLRRAHLRWQAGIGDGDVPARVGHGHVDHGKTGEGVDLGLL